MKNKRGQGLSTNAIVLIILAVVVLVILILGFTLGWDKIAPFLQKNNVENIKTSCTVACTTESSYDFCTLGRTLKAGGDEVFGTCSNLSILDYGIADCPGLCSEA